MTRVEAEIEGDATFPPLDPEGWRVADEERFDADENREYAFRFQTLERA